MDLRKSRKKCRGDSYSKRHCACSGERKDHLEMMNQSIGEYIGYCGVDCSKCSDLTEGKCPGCRQSTWPEGDACPPVACCTEKGISCCGECAEFPCQMMAEFYEESDNHREAYQRMLALRAE